MGKTDANPILFMKFSTHFLKEKSSNSMHCKPKSSDTPHPTRITMVKMIEEGYRFYRNFEYNKGLPVIEKLVMKETSLAKSLRYNFLENTKIKLAGSVGLTKFLFKVSGESELLRINSIINHSRNKSFEASLTHIDNIGGFYPNEKLELSAPFVRSAIAHKSDVKKIWLKCLAAQNAENRIAKFLSGGLGASGVRIVHRFKNFFVAEAVLRDFKPKVTTLLNHCLVTELIEPPEILVHEHYLRHNDLEPDCVEEKCSGTDYPCVAIIDSGVAEKSYLRKWEMGKEIFVEQELQDNAHGTFVTGRALSNGDSFGGIEYLDVVAMPGRKGTGPDTAELCSILSSVVPKYASRIKIWNLSLGTDILAGESISMLAYTLDSLQLEHDVLFVTPSGNYSRLREWEADSLRPEDGITIPAESILSLTVGSVSHIDTNVTPAGAPSLFSRHGRGSCSSVKPELVHYGGTHEKRFNRLLPKGVYSIGKFNEIAEDTGTSHSAPMVAGIAARAYKMLGQAASVDMVKALMIHTAGSFSEKDFPYKGWGQPYSAEEMLITPNNKITILHSGFAEVGKLTETDFIFIPPAMYENGKICGAIHITLVYKPPVDPNFCGHYTCVNLKASLGYHSDGKWTSLLTDRNIMLMPEDNFGKKQFLWQPVKNYFIKLKNRTVPEKLVMRISASKRDFFTYSQTIPYAVVLSFISEDNDIYESYKYYINDNSNKSNISPLNSSNNQLG
jgi:hypothetical protein